MHGEDMECARISRALTRWYSRVHTQRLDVVTSTPIPLVPFHPSMRGYYNRRTLVSTVRRALTLQLLDSDEKLLPDREEFIARLGGDDQRRRGHSAILFAYDMRMRIRRVAAR